METPGTKPPLSRADLKGKMKVNLQDLREAVGGTHIQECDVCDASSSSQGISHHPPTPQGGWKGASVSGKPRTPRDASQNTPRKAPLEPHYQGLTSGVNRPVWFERGMDPPTFPMLTSDQSCDVCVVGGGIAGVTAAYLLAKKGQSVILLEDGEIASGETGRSTAHIASGIDDRYCELVKKHGDANARLIADAHRAAIDRIERIVEKEQIDCEFERLDGYLFLAKEHMGTELLEEELEAAKKAGLHAEMADQTPFSGDHFHSGPALRFFNQAQFQPVKYTYGLAMAAKSRGAKIYTHTHAQRFEEGDTNKVVTSHGHTVTSRHLVMATNVPVNDKLTMYTKVEPFRTYVIACYVPKGVVHRALYWDTADPYHYVRLADDPLCAEREVLIVGGEDHKSGQKHDHHARYNRLYEWTKGRFPEAEPPFCTWSGHIIEPVDDVGFMGRNPGSRENVYIITGDSGNGITHTTIGAMMIRDMVLGAVSPWEEVFSPSRLMTDDIMEYVKHNVSVQMRYKDWLTGGDISDIEELAPGQGAIMREGLKKYAVFKDETGNIVKCSAVCTHLAGMVAWNADEKSWDCPCHGSRFDPWGNVINGPANKPLRRK